MRARARLRVYVRECVHARVCVCLAAQNIGAHLVKMKPHSFWPIAEFLTKNMYTIFL